MYSKCLTTNTHMLTSDNILDGLQNSINKNKFNKLGWCPPNLANTLQFEPTDRYQAKYLRAH